MQQGNGTKKPNVKGLVGAQSPRIVSLPPFKDEGLGVEAVELCRSAGLLLDEWQELVLRASLRRKKDGKWAAFEIGVDVPRQNGKGALLEARELVALFLLGERLTIHSSHQFDTSLEGFRRLAYLIEDTPELDSQVKRLTRSHGEEGIELKNGCRVRFRTRTKGGGRGFSCDCLILDEAMFIPEFTHGALLPTLSARPNSQVWYTGSAVDQMIHDDGIVFARVRERGLKGKDPSLAYFEWSVDAENPDHVEEPGLPEWAVANPGLGIRISAEHVRYELRAMDPRTFAVERLGVGDWPPTDKSAMTVVSLDQWEGLQDVRSEMQDPVVLAFDVSPSRSSGAIAAAGHRPDGLRHVEIVEHRKGTGWMIDRLEELWATQQPAAVLCDGRSPASSLVDKLLERDVPVKVIETGDHAHACGTLIDLIENDQLRHLGQPMMRAAIQGAKQRPLGDAWAWTRSKSTVDITPLVAGTLAVWQAHHHLEPAGDLVLL